MGRLKEAVLAGTLPVRHPPPAPVDPKTERMNARTEADLVELARRRGYRNPEWWAKKVIEGRRKGR